MVFVVIPGQEFSSQASQADHCFMSSEMGGNSTGRRRWGLVFAGMGRLFYSGASFSEISFASPQGRTRGQEASVR